MFIYDFIYFICEGRFFVRVVIVVIKYLFIYLMYVYWILGYSIRYGGYGVNKCFFLWKEVRIDFGNVIF